ncbi:MAG: SCO family protein [Gammaproteobacteria bacterium]|nr:SCO family protein [Gammaproteobacteria bacterium]
MRYLLTAILLLFSNTIFAQVQGTTLDEPKDIPSFTLSDHHGTTFTHQDLLQKWTLIMFGFNSCPDVCPFTMRNLESAIAETSLRVRPDSVPQVVFVSVDPDRDRDTVSDYANFFHPDFMGVTGEREQIDQIVEATDSFYRLMPKDDSGFYDVQHSAFVSVIAPNGKMIGRLEPPFHAGKTAEFLARLQITYRRESES